MVTFACMLPKDFPHWINNYIRFCRAFLHVHWNCKRELTMEFMGDVFGKVKGAQKKCTRDDKNWVVSCVIDDPFDFNTDLLMTVWKAPLILPKTYQKVFLLNNKTAHTARSISLRAAHQYLTPEIAKAPTRLFYRRDSLRGICNSTTRLVYSRSTVSEAPAAHNKNCCNTTLLTVSVFQKVPGAI